MPRLFVAVRLPARVREALARAPFAEPARGGSIRRVDARNLHLTLKFLGDVGESLVPSLTEALGEASRGVEPFDLEVAGLGVFPPRGPPRVVWAGVDGGPALGRVAARVDEAAAAVGVPREDRPFVPHVTLARVKGRRRPRAVLPDDPEVLGRAFGRCRVEGVTLFESELLPAGARHRERATFRCGA